jgi:hypothetical protein
VNAEYLRDAKNDMNTIMVQNTPSYEKIAQYIIEIQKHVASVADKQFQLMQKSTRTVFQNSLTKHTKQMKTG